MKKSLLLVAFALPLMGAKAQQASTPAKFDARLERLVSQAERQRASRATANAPLRSQGQTFSPAELLRVTISTYDDAPALVEAVEAVGGKITAITATYYTAQLPIAQLRTIAERKEVKRIALPRKVHRNLQKARAEVGVDKLHKPGNELSTPFTGKGVVLGVIDQGFQFDHIAFQDKNGKSRVRVGWDRRKDTTSVAPPATLPANEKDATHATHVAAIAGGSDRGNGYQGVAPEADLVLLASTFTNDKIAEELRYVYDFAKRENKPWVVNMSFGSQFGPHDGMSDYDLAIDSLLGPGALVAAAMGNEGGRKLHAHATLQPGEQRYLIIDPPLGGDADDEDMGDDEGESDDEFPFKKSHAKKAADDEDEMGDEFVDDGSEGFDDDSDFPFPGKVTYAEALFGVWGQTTTGTQHLKFTPVVVVDEKIVEIPEKVLEEAMKKTQSLEGATEVETNSKKQVYWAYYNTEAFLQDLVKHNVVKDDPWLDFQLGVRIELDKAAPAAEEVHAWIEVDMGSVSVVSPEGVTVLQGDDDYLVGEGGASIPRAIAVGSYTTATSWKAVLDGGATMTSRDGKLNDISPFSCKGPWLGKQVRPTITAPGSMIISAFNSDAAELEREGKKLVDTRISYEQTVNGKKYYYGAMEGTSMATPFVTGVLCLWLQANPNLSPEQATEILRTTARHDNFTGAEPWSTQWGYGKIDAYAGLKKALELAKTTGIDHASHSPAPFTLSKEEGRCRLLFNNDEAWATVRLFNAEGRLLQQQHLSRVQQGQEEIISTEGLTPGVYLLQLQSPAARTTHRVVVR